MGMYKDLITDAFENIYGLDLEKNGGDMVVCKAIPLLGLPRNPMTLFEMKLFDTYLGRIHPQNPDVTSITFEASELAQLFGVERISNSDLMKALNNLMTRTVTVYDGKERVMFTLLSTAILGYSDTSHSRLRMITLECSEKARKYIYNLGSVRYIKMSLARLVKFSSRHAYAMYQYLNANSFHSEWDVDIYELKAILGVLGKYKDYSDFDKRVLKVALDEINNNTEIRYTYELVLKRGKANKIHFHVIQKDAALEKQIDEEIAEQEQEQVKPDTDVESKTAWLDGKITLGLYDESDEQLAF